MLKYLTLTFILATFAFSVVYISAFRAAHPDSELTVKKQLYFGTSLNNEDQNYSLPEATVVPGNPLWTAKAATAMLSVESTLNSQTKTSKLMDQADYRIAAAATLVNAGDLSLATETAHKGYMYQLRAFELLNVADPDQDLLARFLDSNIRHREVLSDIALVSDGQEQVDLNKTIELYRVVYENLSSKVTRSVITYFSG